MLSRTTTRTVTFLLPFSIAAANQELPAGAYLVETDEELIQELSFIAYRRVATFLRIPQAPVVYAMSVLAGFACVAAALLCLRVVLKQAYAGQ